MDLHHLSKIISLNINIMFDFNMLLFLITEIPQWVCNLFIKTALPFKNKTELDSKLPDICISKSNKLTSSSLNSKETKIINLPSAKKILNVCESMKLKFVFQFKLHKFSNSILIRMNQDDNFNCSHWEHKILTATIRSKWISEWKPHRREKKLHFPYSYHILRTENWEKHRYLKTNMMGVSLGKIPEPQARQGGQTERETALGWDTRHRL